MAFISSMLAAGIRMGIPIAFAGIGVVIAEKSGVLNIGCEGEMLTGSFVTFVVVYFTHSYFLGILAGGAGGLRRRPAGWPRLRLRPCRFPAPPF